MQISRKLHVGLLKPVAGVAEVLFSGGGEHDVDDALAAGFGERVHWRGVVAFYAGVVGGHYEAQFAVGAWEGGE